MGGFIDGTRNRDRVDKGEVTLTYLDGVRLDLLGFLNQSVCQVGDGGESGHSLSNQDHVLVKGGASAVATDDIADRFVVNDAWDVVGEAKKEGP